MEVAPRYKLLTLLKLLTCCTLFTVNMVYTVDIVYTVDRVEICHDRRDRQSCKIFANCVNFFRKQCIFLHNFRSSNKVVNLLLL